MPDEIVDDAEAAGRSAGRGWRIDRNISPAFVLAALVTLAGAASQTYVATTWASSTTAEIADQKRELGRLRQEIDLADKRILDRGDDRYGQVTGRLGVLERDRSVLSEKVVRLETQIQYLVEIAGRTERKIDQLRR